MQTYIHTPDLVYPITSDMIKAAHPNTSFPQYLHPADIIGFGYYPVGSVSPAFDADTQYSTQLAPVVVNGQWVQAWRIDNYTTEELAAIEAAKQAAIAAAAEAAKQAHNDPIKAQIAALDLRRIRPLAEGDSVFLADLNAQIVALRSQLQ